MSPDERDRYLARIGLEPISVEEPDLPTLERLQGGHVVSVPFETLSITGDPFDSRDGEGVSLDFDDLFEKVVGRHRGGFCFELNGLFGHFLGEFGYDVQRTAARIVNGGDGRPPANHLTNVVTVAGERYLVDVGMGVPTLRRPLPIDGKAHEDALGIEWRVVPSDRPDVDRRLEYRRPGGEWDVRHLFIDAHQEMHYFRATCDYLATAPESTFTGDPVVTMATEWGDLKLEVDTLTRYEGGERTEETVAEADWYDALDRVFGVRLGST